MQVFSRADVDINPIHWIPFGSPVYVLAAPLQGSARIHNKWKERARLGIYLGRSPMHARSVALVLSLETGLVSPQFHIVFDPSFRTVHPDQSNQVPTSQWQKKCGFAGRVVRQEVQGNQITDEPQFISPTDVAIVPETEGVISGSEDDMAIRLPDSAEPLPVMEEVVQLEQSVPEQARPTQVQQPEGGLQRSTRTNRGIRTVPTFQMEQEAERVGSTRVPGEFFSFAAMFEHRQHDPEEMQVMSATGDPDTMYYHQAMREPDSGEFLRAVKEEFQGMLANQVLSFIQLARVPAGTVIFPSVWAMKRK
ncbi:MAG: hypothetical protein ACRCT2_15330, partial [Plesiomonas shigelloides]